MHKCSKNYYVPDESSVPVARVKNDKPKFCVNNNYQDLANDYHITEPCQRLTIFSAYSLAQCESPILASKHIW